MINGVVSNPIWADGPSVMVRTVEDAAMVKVAASDHILCESWSIHDQDNASYLGFAHRTDGPAYIPFGGRGQSIFWLWDHSLSEEDHAMAVADGVADDQEQFETWLAKRKAVA